MNTIIETLKYIGTWIEVKLYQIFADDGRRSYEDFDKQSKNTKDV